MQVSQVCTLRPLLAHCSLHASNSKRASSECAAPLTCRDRVRFHRVLTKARPRRTQRRIRRQHVVVPGLDWRHACSMMCHACSPHQPARLGLGQGSSRGTSACTWLGMIPEAADPCRSAVRIVRCWRRGVVSDEAFESASPGSSDKEGGPKAYIWLQRVTVVLCIPYSECRHRACQP